MKATGSGLDATSESTDTRVAGVGLGSGGHKANLGHAGNNAEFDEGKPSVEKAPCGGAAARELLRGRSVLVTGATGFLGKVLVEKLIRCFSDVRRVFLLVRAGKGRLATERVKLEIINSPIFQTLERSWGREKVIERCEEILVAVNGDITLPRLGISDADFARMDMENIEIFFHCAASVNFDDPLEQALQLNTQGALEALEVARRLKVRAMVHVSTAYVAANIKTGQKIPEKIHEMDFDPEDVLQSMQREVPSSSDGLGLSRMQLRIQGEFPNTYTLTKAMGEVMLSRRHGDVPLAIVRPSIVGAAWREPCPGWVDVVSAASAVFMGTILGVVTMLPGNPRGVAALIPVDFVVNHMLRACVSVWDRQGDLQVSHSCSSAFNPCRWRVVSNSVLASYRNKQPASKLTPGPVKFRMLQNRQQFALEWALRYSLPTWAYGRIAAFGGGDAAKLANKLQMLQDRAEYLVSLFEPFTTVEYIFDCSTAKRWSLEDKTLRDGQSPGSIPMVPTIDYGTNKLCVNALDIVWTRYIENYTYGLDRFILNENVVPISQSAVTHNDVSLTLGRLLKWDPDHHRISFPGMMSDISWAYTSSRKPGYTRSGVLGRLMGLTGWREGLAHEAKHVPRSTKRSPEAMRALVMRSNKVKAAIKDELKAELSRIKCKSSSKTISGSSPSTNDASLRSRSSARAKVLARANALFDEIASTLVDGPPRWLGWALRKIWRKMYDGIRVHEEGLEHLRAAAAAAQYPIVLVPTHRSYVDFVMLSFLMFAFNLPVPFIASTTDFLKMNGVSGILRSAGAFFLRRQGALEKDPLYAAVFTAYTQQLLVDRQIVEYYIEGTRSRSGKCLDPKSGLTSICIEPVRDGRLQDLIFVPISIDYEKPVEATLYSHEMLGSSKMPETTENLLKSMLRLGKSFGYISVQFGEHIMARQELQRATPAVSPARALGLQIIHAMQGAAVCMPIHLVATLLLTYRHGLTLDQLASSVEWLREEVLRRGGHVACAEGEDRTDLVKRAMHLLGDTIQRRQSPRVVQVAVDSATKDYHKMVILGYYRNKIIHLFASEGFWACGLYARTDSSTGLADLEFVQEDALLLESLLRREFIRTPRDVRDSLLDLQDRNIIEIAKDGKVRVAREHSDAERVYSLLCSMVWPLIDSYFVAVSALLALLPDAKVEIATLIQRMLTLAENLYHDQIIVHYESCASVTLQNAVETLKDWGVLTTHRKECPKRIGQERKIETFVTLLPPFNSRDHLHELVRRVDSLRGPRIHRGTTASSTTSSVADFPMLARI